ncbi:hypothetical protein [Clostridium tetani]|uniref:hypothetical protein n=1 Tax=Clostridium tetani TaxID=1513 RepID=UPI0010266CCA|nr:hypothetical protein [Clostridium tetani]RXI70479.1 hypothetical protein DP127_09265 [Clostridium tetani]
MKEKRKTKPVPFTGQESDLLEWAENQGKPFATYVKDLIRQDKNKKTDKYDKVELKEILKEILKEMDLKENKLEVTNNKENTLGTKSKKAYKNILGNIGRS